MAAQRVITPASVAAWRHAIAQHQPWERATGPRTPAGKRRMTENATAHGLDGGAFRAALRYIAAVTRALDAAAKPPAAG